MPTSPRIWPPGSQPRFSQAFQAPTALAQLRLEFVGAAAGGQQQQHGGVGGGFGHRLRRVGQGDAAPAGGLQVEMIGADRIGADDPNRSGQGVDGRRLQALGQGDQQGLGLMRVRAGDDFACLQHPIFRVAQEIEMNRQFRFRLLRQAAGQDQAGLVHGGFLI